MEIIRKIKERAHSLQRTIVLPETKDSRVLKAAKIVIDEKLAKLILLSDDPGFPAQAKSMGLDISQARLIAPSQSPFLEEFSQTFYESRKHKGITPEDALMQIKNPVYFGAMLVSKGIADGLVAGAITTTADVAKAAMYCIGFGERIKTISSSFLISVPNCEYGVDGVFVFADCGIVPDPSPSQLANIAVAASELFRLLVESEPRVALLSFSTKGSAEHEMVEKVARAKGILDEKFPELLADGELQFDAAIVPEVAQIKAPESKVAGKANVLIFPDLNAGNICYKMAQRLAKAEVTGPMMTGLKKPCCDLSRGCTVDEVVNAVCSTAIRVVS